MRKKERDTENDAIIDERVCRDVWMRTDSAAKLSREKNALSRSERVFFLALTAFIQETIGWATSSGAPSEFSNALGEKLWLVAIRSYAAPSLAIARLWAGVGGDSSVLGERVKRRPEGPQRPPASPGNHSSQSSPSAESKTSDEGPDSA